jgi:hypothetical protein
VTLAGLMDCGIPIMSRRSKRKRSTNKQSAKTPKRDYRVHPVKTLKGHGYKFIDKHHYPPKEDHACWLNSISRETEFLLFQDAETGDYSDDRGNLYNVHKDGEEYIEIGTRYELLAIFWNPHSAAEWHGHPRWPIKTREAFNRKNESYRPSKAVMQKMVEAGRISQRDGDRILRGNHP